MYQVQHTQLKGRCLVAAREIVSGEVLLGGKKKQDKSDSSSAQNKRGTDEVIETMVPPVLVESRRSTHCIVCFRKAGRRSDHDHKNAKSQLYAMVTCKDPACSNAALASGLVDEDLIIRRVLQQQRIPKIFPTALLVYRLLLVSSSSENIGSTRDTKETRPPRRLSWSEILDMVPQQQQNQHCINEAAHAHEHAILFTVFSLWQETTRSGQVTVRPPLQPHQLLNQIREALSRVKANAFSITSNDTTCNDDDNCNVVGIALFDKPGYLVNHACRPNTTQTFRLEIGRFPILELKANQPIHKGEEITISYSTMHPSSSREERRQALQQAYHFICQCASCS